MADSTLPQRPPGAARALDEPSRQRPNRRVLGSIGAHGFLILASVLLAGPFLWELLTSFKSLTESVAVPPTLLPSSWHLSNYTNVLDAVPFGSELVNSVINALARTAAQLLFCSMAAFAFAWLKFRGRGVVFALFLSVLLVPTQLLVIPQYQIMQDLHLLNTIPALFLPGMFSAFGTFLLRQFFLSLPPELHEAARLDGAGPVRIFWSIMLPLARPGLLALGLLTMIWSWNDLLWPLIVNDDPGKMTLSVGLANLQGVYLTNYPVLMAGALMATLPLIIVFVVMQRRVVEGIALTGTKG
ncbi:carbohydrate ABC transporter permease [Actinospica robiniae]|uniref:Carbohydrate ABC transporter membrane protein 2, CUT1 family n=1 Tax=Actinospica robiniae DSM 44927 TaxID=479430 RepID=W9E4G5_9ACTN|nr:carbohydrate ABC transporter permease [Actinospica robiniae]ETA71047.1 carbohydrate ABC transporter membrane protein 2, CUT1 family [Actinospica robiniae DSM 44927]